MKLTASRGAPTHQAPQNEGAGARPDPAPLKQARSDAAGESAAPGDLGQQHGGRDGGVQRLDPGGHRVDTVSSQVSRSRRDSPRPSERRTGAVASAGWPRVRRGR
ncbi:hypothetical protein GCM10017786_40450 [Amycolatopsis deserti]|uniref:Uncharacterized protein n=1 Tax=Amycolatopsis deserti TaxID=185696 RepID=A0ABQ3J3H1_9PSEU|nr:hypothetical protein GCM10017786_40450 [Amycolatopsis deserti]